MLTTNTEITPPRDEVLHRSDIAVVGGGIVGLSIAWELTRAGYDVLLYDPAPARGATHVAAGMLGAIAELWYGEEALLPLALASRDLYPAFLESLPDTGTDSEYQASPTLFVGVDGADRQTLQELREFQSNHGAQVQSLTVKEARECEHLLSSRISYAHLLPSEHRVNPRALAATLMTLLGQRIVRRHVRELLGVGNLPVHDGFRGVEFSDGTRAEAREIIVANAVNAKNLAGLPYSLDNALRPVYGDVVRVRTSMVSDTFLGCTIRGYVQGSPIYCVPRADGTLVIGATQREHSGDVVRAGGVYELLRDAMTLIPAIAECEFLGAQVRARPGTPDNAPLLGRMGDGLIAATGFFRHGVLLAPIAAHVCRDLVVSADSDSAVDDVPSPLSFTLDAFRPDRFLRSGVTIHR